jgi:hypothetical protein
MSEDSAAVPTDYEREKWQTEVDFRRQELSFKEREQSRLAAEAERSRWWNPLFIAIVGATIAAIGSVAVSWWNGKTTQQTELLRAESARILEMIHTTDIPKAKDNLSFLLAAGLITGSTAVNVRKYLEQAAPDQGPLLPSSTLVQPRGPNVEAAVISEFVCPGGNSEKRYWIYRYTERPPGDPTFNVILPPNWGQPIGGHGLFTRQDAEKVVLDACNSKG